MTTVEERLAGQMRNHTSPYVQMLGELYRAFKARKVPLSDYLRLTAHGPAGRADLERYMVSVRELDAMDEAEVPV